MTARAADLVQARSVDWQVVDSSNVHSALYNEGDADFYVRFLRSGPDDIYVYPDRSPAEWQDFRTATSKGGWIWDNAIDGNWPYDRLTMRDFADVEPDDVAPATRNLLFRQL
jgi:hypothetical protein